VHPDREELAAWQAGASADPERARTEAHLAGCADCAGAVASVERGRAALASLAGAEMPAGLHERLAAAVERELPALDGAAREAAGGADGERLAARAGPVRLHRRVARGRRARAGHRRFAALSAAAAVILLVAGLVPLLLHVVGQTGGTAGSGGGALASKTPAAGAPSAADRLPVFQASGSYTASRLRASLTSNPAVRSAYQRAVAGSASLSGGPAGSPPATAQGAQPDLGRPEGTAGTERVAPAGLQERACVTAAQEQAGTEPLRPAFFVNAVYSGRPATVLVTVRARAPAQAELWAFPRNDCSLPPFAHERVAVSPP